MIPLLLQESKAKLRTSAVITKISFLGYTHIRTDITVYNIILLTFHSQGNIQGFFQGGAGGSIRPPLALACPP